MNIPFSIIVSKEINKLKQIILANQGICNIMLHERFLQYSVRDVDSQVKGGSVIVENEILKGMVRVYVIDIERDCDMEENCD